MIPATHYQMADPKIWQGRTDTLTNERFFQMVECVDLMAYPFTEIEANHAIIGFCCDEGVRRNQGRPGAASGPDAIRKHFAGLAAHTSQRFLDFGNIICQNGQLELAQTQLAQVIERCQRSGLSTIALGGGHEIAWGHFQGLASHHPNIGIINIDAHFDLRLDSQATSGTSFAQIKHYCDVNQRSFHYCCLGIQSSANTGSLFQRAQDWGVTYLTAEQMVQLSLGKQLEVLNLFMRPLDAIYLSICMDAFAESVAPGVSAPQALGLNPWQSIALLKYIVQSGKVVGLDIAELSPPLDLHEKTSRLAARLLAELLNQDCSLPIDDGSICQTRNVK